MALSSAKLPGLAGLARPLLPVGAVALALSLRAASPGDSVVVCTVLFRRSVDAPFCECRMAFARQPAAAAFASPPPAPFSGLAGPAPPALLLVVRATLLR